MRRLFTAIVLVIGLYVSSTIEDMAQTPVIEYCGGGAGVNAFAACTTANPLPTGNASVGATGATAPASATFIGITSGGNLTGWTGAVTQSGTWNVGSSSQYPVGATPETASTTGTTAATTATLAAASNVTTYICGFSIRANATAAATGNATVTGTITGTLNFTQWTAPLASGIGLVEETFEPCVPASATNTTIAVVSAAPGSGGTVSVSAWGYTK